MGQTKGVFHEAAGSTDVSDYDFADHFSKRVQCCNFDFVVIMSTMSLCAGSKLHQCGLGISRCAISS